MKYINSIKYLIAASIGAIIGGGAVAIYYEREMEKKLSIRQYALDCAVASLVNARSPEKMVNENENENENENVLPFKTESFKNDIPTIDYDKVKPIPHIRPVFDPIVAAKYEAESTYKRFITEEEYLDDEKSEEDIILNYFIHDDILTDEDNIILTDEQIDDLLPVGWKSKVLTDEYKLAVFTRNDNMSADYEIDILTSRYNEICKEE